MLIVNIDAKKTSKSILKKKQFKVGHVSKLRLDFDEGLNNKQGCPKLPKSHL